MKVALSLYRRAALRAFRSLPNAWPIMLALPLALFALNLLGAWIGILGVAGGFIYGLLQVVVLTYYYSWLQAVIDGEKLTRHSMSSFDQQVFFGFISVQFLIYIGELVLSSFVVGVSPGLLLSFYYLGIAFVFNPIPEVVVCQRADGFSSFRVAFEFARDHVITWFLPLVIVLGLICLQVAPESVLAAYSSSGDPLRPSAIPSQALAQVIGGLPGAGIGLVFAIWWNLFRLSLFEQLSLRN